MLFIILGGDEETFPWRGSDNDQPLNPSIGGKAAEPDDLHLLDSHRVHTTPPLGHASDVPAPTNTISDPVKGDPVADLNLPTPQPLAFLSLFSGPHYRARGLPCNLRDLGWDKVTQIDSHGKTGWAGDLMNDELYTTLKSDVSEGKYDVLFIASPCTTFSMSRFFTLPGNDPGPPVIHNIDYPDGLPWDGGAPNKLSDIRKLPMV